MNHYTSIRVTPEIEQEMDRLAKLTGVAKSNIPAMCINMVLTYFTDKQIMMEAPVHLPKDGRRKN